MPTTPISLPYKQSRFVSEYSVDRNATAAAIRAGYSKATALNGYLMTIPKIKMAIQLQDRKLAKKSLVDADMVMRELCKIAFGNMGNYFDADGAMKPMNKLSDDEKAALWSVSVTDAGSGSKNTADEVVKFRMYNKLSALDKIAKCLNMYKPEIKETEEIFLYARKETLDKHDAYDDEDMKYMTEWDNAVDSTDSGKSDSTDLNGGSSIDIDAEENVPLDEDGGPLCDGAGIPYGKIRPTFTYDLDEPLDEMHARVKRYEDGDDSAAISAANHLLIATKAKALEPDIKPVEREAADRSREMRGNEEIKHDDAPKRNTCLDLRMKK